MIRARSLVTLIALVAAVSFAGCQSSNRAGNYEPLVARFYLESKPGETGTVVSLPVSGVEIVVNPKPVIVEYDIANAEVARVDLGECLWVQLTRAAARDLYRLSVAGMGRRLVLSLNDSPVGARRIEQTMADGVIVTFVEAPDAELPLLVNRLKRTSANLAAVAQN
jgi:hypothetical protein